MKICNIIIIASLFTQSVIAQIVSPPSEIVKVAQENFIQFLTGAVTEDTKTMVGFRNGDNLKNAVLGEPFQINNLSADSIRQYNGTAPIDKVVTRTDMWYFPVLIDGSIRVMLYVGKKNGVWMRAGIGSAGLATQVNEIVKQWAVSDGYVPMLVHQQDVGKYYYSIPKVSNSNLTETGDVMKTPGLGKRRIELSSLETTINELRGKINR